MEGRMERNFEDERDLQSYRDARGVFSPRGRERKSVGGGSRGAMLEHETLAAGNASALFSKVFFFFCFFFSAETDRGDSDFHGFRLIIHSTVCAIYYR